jgi:hypothetical protein
VSTDTWNDCVEVIEIALGALATGVGVLALYAAVYLLGLVVAP